MKKIFFSTFFIFSLTISQTGFTFSSNRYHPNYHKKKQSLIQPQSKPFVNKKKKKEKSSLSSFLNLSFLYLQPIEQGLDLGGFYSINESNETITPQKLDTDYHPAFKIELGSNFNTENWWLCLNYVRLQSKDITKQNINNPTSTNTLISSWNNTQNLIVSDMEATWKLDYNLFDLSTKKEFRLNKNLIFTPFFGIKAGWIDQKYKIEQTLDSKEELSTFSKSDSWMVGPKVAFTPSWLICESFCLEGTIETALFFQDFKTEYKSQDDNNIRSNQKCYEINPEMSCGINLKWLSFFANNQIKLGLSAGYDFHVLFNQNQMKSLAEKTKKNQNYPSFNYSKEGNLMLHGVVISGMLYF